MNTAGEEIKRWNFFRALPVRWIGPRLEAKGGLSYPVERIEIAHEGIEVDNDLAEVVDFHLGKICLESHIFLMVFQFRLSILLKMIKKLLFLLKEEFQVNLEKESHLQQWMEVKLKLAMVELI